MHYRQVIDYDSNPFREVKRDMGKQRSIFFSVFCVYIPIFILTIAIRAVMILSDHTIINLRVVDDMILKLVFEVTNLLTMIRYTYM